MASNEQRVAVVGAGIAGLASALLLKKQGKRVTLFESEDRCGGHALTFDTEEFGPIDLGFQVGKDRPHFVRLHRGIRGDRMTREASSVAGVQSVHLPTSDGHAPDAGSRYRAVRHVVCALNARARVVRSIGTLADHTRLTRRALHAGDVSAHHNTHS